MATYKPVRTTADTHDTATRLAAQLTGATGKRISATQILRAAVQLLDHSLNGPHEDNTTPVERWTNLRAASTHPRR